MKYRYKLTPETPMKSDTDLFKRLEIWTGDDIGSETPTWDANYGDALMDCIVEYDPSCGYWLTEDFNDVVEWDDDPSYVIVERVLSMRSWRTSEYDGYLTTRIEQLTLRDFNEAKYFSYDEEGRIVCFPDELSLRSFLEGRVDREKFVRWIAENRAK